MLPRLPHLFFLTSFPRLSTAELVKRESILHFTFGYPEGARAGFRLSPE
jgi:hypothetical protein